jgi:hypothetical protein
MNPLAHPPKMLPWLAHKAGISERRAEALWRSALRHAGHVGKSGSPEFWRAASDELLQLVAAESRREDEASFGWRPWSRNLKRLMAVRMEAIDEIALAPIRSLRILGHQGTHARPH